MSNLQVQVLTRRIEAEGICSYELARADGAPLPAFSAGAHIDVHLPGGLVRQYSLCNDDRETHRYRIAVLRDPASRGGSVAVHEQVQEDDTLTISAPRNHFPLVAAPFSLLLAGGIGITPFIAMMDQMEREGKNFELHYAVRTRTHGAYWKELQQRYGTHRVKVYCDAEKLFIPVDAIVENQPLGTHLYVCGPAGMINGVLGKARAQGWPKQNLHSEEFLAPPKGKAFQAKLVRSNLTVDVGPEQSILEAVEAAGVDAPYLCRGGACGQCETAVVSCDGELEHNDHFLEPEDKASGKKIMICVSRIKGSAVTLDL